MKRTIITISRVYGAGGHLVGQQLAERLGIPLYDKALIDMIAKETGLAPAFIEQAEQARTPSLLYGLYTSASSLPVYDQIDVSERKVIRDLAQKGSCIMLGRCADYLLQGDPDLTRIFIYAPLAERVKKVSAARQLDEDKALSEITKCDKRRAAYYAYVTGQKIGNCENYDLMVNSAIGLDRALAAILACLPPA
ncbi:MAG: cytidylate kinase-like family protein [Clostridia bacterium]